MLKKYDCNNCERRNCSGDVTRDKFGRFKRLKPCPGQMPIAGGTFKFAELLLDHPQSTHEVLSALPIKTRFYWYLK